MATEVMIKRVRMALMIMMTMLMEDKDGIYCDDDDIDPKRKL